jgi:hypothetical protein
VRTGVKKLASDTAALERELMATRFVGDSEVGTSLMPLLTMGIDTRATGAVLGQKMSQLVAECPLNLGGGDLKQLGI